MRQFELRLFKKVIQVSEKERAVVFRIPTRKIFQRANDLQIDLVYFAGTAYVHLQQVTDIQGALAA